MPIKYDITTDIRYQQGVEAGKDAGMAEQAKQTASRLLKMSNLSLQKIADLVEMPLDSVIEIQNEMTAKKKK